MWVFLPDYCEYESFDGRRCKQSNEQFFSTGWWFEVGLIFKTLFKNSSFVGNKSHYQTLFWICSIPFSVDDISKSIPESDLSDVDPPAVLRENPGFFFLQPKATWWTHYYKN